VIWNFNGTVLETFLSLAREGGLPGVVLYDDNEIVGYVLGEWVAKGEYEGIAMKRSFQKQQKLI
jgi:hypothetical protein